MYMTELNYQAQATIHLYIAGIVMAAVLVYDGRLWHRHGNCHIISVWVGVACGG